MFTMLRAHATRLPDPVRQFMAYATIGAFTTSLDAALFAALVRVLDWRQGVQPVLASTLSYGTAATLAYVLNSRFAFRDRHPGHSAATMMRFGTTFASSAALAAAVFAAVAFAVGGSPLALVLAKSASITAVIAWNFALLRSWVFTGATAGARQRPSG